MIGAFSPHDLPADPPPGAPLSIARRVVLVLLFITSFQQLDAQEGLFPVLHFNHLPTGLCGSGMRSRVVRDDRGFIWLGTENGLERYDGYGFREYHNIPDDPRSISSNSIMSLLVDTKHRLWVGTYETGLSLYDAASDRFVNFLPRPGDSSWIQEKSVFALMEDRAGNIWLGLEYGGVARLELPGETESNGVDSLARRIRFKTQFLGTPRNSALDLFERRDGAILVASDSGMLIIDHNTGALTRPHRADPLGRRLDTLSLHAIAEDQHGNLWVGSGTEGLFKLEPNGGRVLNYRHREYDSLSISSDYVMDLVIDQRGDPWIATPTRLDLFSPATGRRIPYLTFDRAPRLTYLNQLSVDRTGTLWLATGEDGVYWLSPKSRRFPNFSIPEPGGSPKLFETIERGSDGTFWCSSLGRLFQVDIHALRVLKTIDVFRGRTQTLWEPDNSATLIDGRGNFWYGTWGLGLYRVNLATGHMKNFDYYPQSTKVPIAMSIAQGSGNCLWTSAYRDGLMKFDPVSGQFQKLLAANFKFPYHVMKDRGGKIWVSLEKEGLFVYDPATGTSDRFVHDPANPHSLSDDRIRKTYQDPSGRIWVAAKQVINLWDSAARSFTRYSNFASNQPLSITPIGSDRKGRVWINNGSEGLSILDPSSGKFTRFDASDGVCGYVVDMENLDDGRILLTGTKGLNIINPDSIGVQRPPPSLVITGMAVNDRPIPLPALQGGSGSLRLTYKQDVLEIEFAAIDIDAPDLVQYRYQLEGLEKDWVRPIGHRYVRYAAIPPGDYVFRARAASALGEWSEQELTVTVNIAPPWWRTAWAYGAYVFLCIGLLYAGYQVRARQVHLQHEVEMEHFKSEHLAEVDRLKSRFFANISHEFRTPLTLILGPVQKLRDRAAEEDEKHDLQMAERNTHRLLRLINQLLDLSKMEAGAMKLRASRLNIVPLVKGIAFSFESSAGMRGIALTVRAEEEDVEIYCDRDILEKILTNLLSNAFKFTPERGKVDVALTRSGPASGHISPGGERDGREGIVEISVSDTGIGIPRDQLDKVFDRFYQVDASQTREYEGSGLGLALVKELVELHHGTIQVQSEAGRGATFTVRLPLGRSHFRDDEIVEVPPGGDLAVREVDGAGVTRAIEGARDKEEPEQPGGEHPIILVVEDNADVRAYIKEYLAPEYHVSEAGDGAEGIEKALEVIPDLIISDVMMPKKDGYEVCRTLKLDEKTNHIPIILLTAKAASENKIEGLQGGADDYLIKPFEPKELLARVRNLIDLRRKLRERFNTAVPLKPGEIAVSSIDDVFLKKVAAVVEQRMSDEDLNVEDLGRDVGMSRSQLHRKLTALTNQSPSDFIRYMRLHRAMALLEGNAGTVSEVAYSVGFGDPSHFSRRFHELFGITPGEVRKAPSKEPRSAKHQ